MPNCLLIISLDEPLVLWNSAKALKQSKSSSFSCKLKFLFPRGSINFKTLKRHLMLRGECDEFELPPFQ
jgi:hypothetical protein